MKLNWTRDEGELIATFGGARLIKYLDGKIELRGGSAEDRNAAREWCSAFMPQAVPVCGG